MISVRSGLAPIVTMMAATLLQPNLGLALDSIEFTGNKPVQTYA